MQAMKTSHRIPMGCLNILLLGSFLLSILTICTAEDTITANQSIRDGETLVSAGGSFQLGFFTPSGSTNRYLGIWYKNITIENVVWVANRENPLNDTTGVLKVTQEGLLVVLNHTEGIIWSSNTSRSTKSPVAQLLESGNLVVKDGNDHTLLWQSFDHPSDTLLPGMKLGINTLNGLDRYLSSWKSSDDPAQGDFTFKLDPSTYPQLFVLSGLVKKFRLGPWNGAGFNGMPNLKPNPFFTYEFVFTKEEIYYSYELINSSVVTKLVLRPNGVMQRLQWITRTQDWLLYTTTQTDNCDNYALCGAYGSCNIGNSPACGCLKGFEPKYPQEWDVADWSNGCVRRTQLDCGESDGFLEYDHVKIPDTRDSWFNQSMTLQECKTLCSKNCSCTAYANMDVRQGGSGCFLWFSNLMDIREYSTDGQDLYVKMSSSELGQIGTKKQRGLIAVVSAILAGVLVVAMCLTLYIWNKKREKRLRKGRAVTKSFHKGSSSKSKRENSDFHLFDLAIIAKATNKFSAANKIGEGGFGPVYKGVFEDGQEIAVKRLSKESEQGNDEFKNEVTYIARLQHRNLVKLLGYCLEGKEKMLIYEYLPKKSLDLFIFDKIQCRLLDWPKRFHIIKGIARGLLYLHQDSRLRIVHRDLKAGNILLDNDLNPKISDFGTARSFRGNETEANTKRIVGTLGYISPEYAMDGLFSVKSDVYSFGVLVLEIVSGKTNRRFQHPSHRLNLVGHAWKLFNEGRSKELIDMSIEASMNLCELLRAVHVGLLCVQQCPDDRPNMSSVVLMLEGESALAQPDQPGFFTKRNLLFEDAAAVGIADSSPSKDKECSINMVTVTLVEGR